MKGVTSRRWDRKTGRIIIRDVCRPLDQRPKIEQIQVESVPPCAGILTISMGGHRNHPTYPGSTVKWVYPLILYI